MCLDALHREESCGGHFREEYQTADGEARRDDEHFAYVAAWEYTGDRTAPRLQQGAAGVRERAPRAAELQVAGDPLRRSMNLTLHVWRQTGPGAAGRMVRYQAHDVSPDMSFLEMLDVVNEGLIETGREPDRVRSRLPRRDLRHRAAS